MNKFTSLALLVFISSIILISIIPAQAQTDLAILLRIANQAMYQIQSQLNDDTPTDIKNLFEEGVNEVRLLEDALTENDIASAKQHFLSAMTIFKKISQIITQTTTMESATQRVPDPNELHSDLERVVNFLSKLKLIAERQRTGIDFTEIDNLIESAKTAIRNDQYEEAEETIAQVNHLIIDINKTLHEYANQQKMERMKLFVKKYLDELDRLILFATENDYPQETIDKLEQAKQSLSEASETDEIIKQIREIIHLKQELDISKINVLESRINQLESRLQRLSNIDSIDIAQIDEARQILAELKNQTSQNNYENAVELLKSLTQLIISLENSVA
jgi:Flp pilus assembly protein TadD